MSKRTRKENTVKAPGKPLILWVVGRYVTYQEKGIKILKGIMKKKLDWWELITGQEQIESENQT